MEKHSRFLFFFFFFAKKAHITAPIFKLRERNYKRRRSLKIAGILTS